MAEQVFTFLGMALAARGIVWALFWSMPATRLRPYVQNPWLGYALDCMLCQVFWVALIWLSIAHGLCASVVLAAFAHLALAEVANRIWQRLSPRPSGPTPPRRRGGCGGSG